MNSCHQSGLKPSQQIAFPRGWRRWMLAWGWGMGIAGLSLLLPGTTWAQSASRTTVESLLERIDAIANEQALDQLSEIYSPAFVNSDGLTFDDLEASLTELWALYPDLTYETQLKKFTQSGSTLVVETVTTITGQRDWLGQTAQLNGEIKARQTFEGDKLIQQEILAESLVMTAGEVPPEVTVRLPERVKPGDTFDFDVILQTPIGEDLLAGNAFAQDISPENYLQPTQVKLELLQAGGLFKRAIAGDDPQWLSGLLISPDGMVLVTRRLVLEK